jgi:uncharacterized protein (DUF1501 family)
MDPRVQPIDRRAFVLGSLWGLGGLAARPLDLRPTPGAARTLVLIQLTGGNDGLSTLVPHADDAYARARSATRIATEEVLRLDERFGLHPKLVRLREIFEHGRLALVQGVGYPEPNRSHFRSMDVWHAADARGREAGTGWIGRCIAGLPDPATHAVVHFGAEPPFSLYSARAPLCLTSAVLDATDPARTDRLQPLGAPELSAEAASETLAALRERISETSSSLATLRAALARPTPKVAYPSSSFAQDLRRAASLIHGELGVRVCSLELDGFDTHGNQRGRHDRLMGELDRALDAFTKDLQKSEAGREALVLLFSEFGRRVEENASGGTDHGAAGLALALGSSVRGGLYGAAPSLDALRDGDLAFTTDFRSLYASCIQHVFGLDPALVLGGSHPAIDFV